MAGTSDPQAERLGRVLMSRRAALGMKRKDLAAAAGLSYPYVAELENGAKTPSARALNALAAALGLTPSALLAGVETLPTATHAVSSALRPTGPADAAPQVPERWLPESRDAEDLVERVTRRVVSRVLEETRWRLERELPDVVRFELAQEGID